METQHYINLETIYGANNYAPLDVVITKDQGIWVEDVDGNYYMDCLSAYSVVNQGHCHPRIVETLIEQAQKIQLTSRDFRNDQLGSFYKKVSQLTGYEMALPMNTGAEAVETAIKAARKWGYTIHGAPDGKAEIITCRGNFHGRTVGCCFWTMSLTRDCEFGMRILEVMRQPLEDKVVTISRALFFSAALSECLPPGAQTEPDDRCPGGE